MVSNTNKVKYRIAGHESFCCRYTWLPKAVQGLTRNPKLFADEEKAMVDLGLGKNMVRSVRFWAQASGMMSPINKGGGHQLTDFGRVLLGERGLDPFLEDIRTLWLVHWSFSTDASNPLLAWDFLLNRWQEPDIVPSIVLKALQREASRYEGGISPVTIDQHLDTFLHTYIPTRGRKGEILEDNLDCPLVELELLLRLGERPAERDAGRAEPIYAFRRQDKAEITSELFAYCLNDFWNNRHATDSTLSFCEVAHGHGSPGQILKLPEDDVRQRVEQLEKQTNGYFSYAESANLQQLHRKDHRDSIDLLRDIYRREVHDV